MSDVRECSAPRFVADFAQQKQQLEQQCGLLPLALRQAAITAFADNGLPTTALENWRYTDIAKLTKQSFASQVAAGSLSGERLQQWDIPNVDCYRLVLVNGRVNTACSTLPETAGVTVRSINDALNVAVPELVSTINDARLHNDAFSALNTALSHDGYCVVIQAGVVLDKPLHVLHVNASDTNFVNHQRNVIYLAADSRAQVIEQHVSVDTDSRHFNNIVSQVVLAEGSQLDYTKLQIQDNNAFHIANTDITQLGNSQFTCHLFSLGGAIARDNLVSRLTQPGCKATLQGLYLPSGRQHSDIRTTVDHLAPDTFSDESFRGILSDRARAVFNGNVIVRKNAQHVVSSQQNKNLLLSDAAEIDTKPQLEIYANDVKCAHGATVGQLNPQELFYLQARGIPEDEAATLLTLGFALAQLEPIEDESLRSYVRSLVEAKL